MNRAILMLSMVALALVPLRFASAHCEVPCGIYGDQMRFEQMLEDTETIAKAIRMINEMTEGEIEANTVNQMVRWVTTKEDHAVKTQHTIAQYFMAQRIKPDSENYEKTLKAAHAVMIAAMKCKQAADPATAETLKQAIYDLYRAYEGKEPVFEHED